MEVARGSELKHKMTTEMQDNVKLKARTRPDGTGLRMTDFLTLNTGQVVVLQGENLCRSKPTAELGHA